MITADQLQRASTRFTMHLDGQGFFENHWVCVDFPRLTIVQRGPRGRAAFPFSKTFFVDGRACVSLDEVLVALNAAPAIDAAGAA